MRSRSAVRPDTAPEAISTTEPAGGIASPATGMTVLWDRMMLSARTAGAGPLPRLTVPAGLRHVLRLVTTATAGSLTGGLSAPSAGALYPYEHYAVVAGSGGPAVYALDVVRRSCRLLREGVEVREALERTDLRPPRGEEALLLTVVRPWLSMRKYGHRGYLYAQLDAAHAAAHLSCLSTQSHRRSELRTRLSPGPLAELLNLTVNCRFLHSVLTLGEPVSDNGGEQPPRWNCVDGRDVTAVADVLVSLEGNCWRILTEYIGVPDTGPAAATRLTSLLPAPTAPSGSRLPGASSLADLAAQRRSTKDFAPATLRSEALDQALAAMHLPLATDLDAESGLRVTLVARSVDGRAPYVQSLAGRRPFGTVPTVVTGNQLVEACMGQEHLRHACALVLFHLPRHNLLRHGRRGVDSALLRAGVLAHLLYLGAVGAHVDITTIGGFDSGRWQHLARLPEQDEVLYMALLGVRGRSGQKLDRLQPAYAHDER